MTLTILSLVALFFIGAAFGSFISVLIYRIHHGKPGIVRGRSQCAICDTQLKAKDLIPLVSFLMLRGNCRYCNRSISYMYPLLELVSGALAVLLFLKFPFVDAALQFDLALLLRYLLHLYFAVVLIFIFFFDLKYHHVVDELLVPAVVIGLIGTLVPGQPNPIDALFGLVLGAGFFALQYAVSRGKWVGDGDIRIGALMGVMLGLQLTIVGLFVAYLIGSVASIFIALRAKKFYGVKVPFAPFLVAGTYVAFFFGENIVQWYLTALMP